MPGGAGGGTGAARSDGARGEAIEAGEYAGGEVTEDAKGQGREGR